MAFGSFSGLDRLIGDVDRSVRRLYFPVHIFLDTVTADIVAVLTQLVKVIRRFQRRLGIMLPETALYFGRTGYAGSSSDEYQTDPG